jgi:hypothetical protein
VTVTGGATNTVSFGTVATLTSFSCEYNNVQYDSTNNKIVYLAKETTSPYENFSLVFTSDGSTLTQVSSTSLTSAYVSNRYYTLSSVFVPNRGINYMFSTASNSILTFGASLGSTTSSVVNGSQFVGTARSGTDLELSEPPVELVGMANGSITKGKPVIVRTD